MKTKIITVDVIVEKTKTGFSAYTAKYPIGTTGKTIEEIQNNMYEAINFYFEDEKVKILKSNIKYELDLKQFFQYYKVLNAKFLASSIGMNASLLSQYVQGKRKPSLKQTEKIIIGINKIGKELSEMNFIYR